MGTNFGADGAGRIVIATFVDDVVHPSQTLMVTLEKLDKVTAADFDPWRLAGKNTEFAGRRAIEKDNGATHTITTGPIGGYRIDISSIGVQRSDLEAIATTLSVVGETASVQLSESSSLRLVGAHRGLAPVRDFPSTLNFGPVASISYRRVGSEEFDSVVTIVAVHGQAAHLNNFLRVTMARSAESVEDVTVNGLPGVRVACAACGADMVSWADGETQYVLWANDEADLDVMALAPMVRPASPTEWARLND